MKLKNFVQNSKKAFYDSTKRFPITIGVCIVLVTMLIIMSEKQPNLSISIFEVFQRVNMTIALGIPLSPCFKLIFEKKDSKKSIQILTYILGIGCLVLYYFYIFKDFNNVNMIRYVGLSIFLYIAFFYIPWIGNKEYYENYVIKILGNFVLAFIYAVVLYFGFIAIFFTVDKLFLLNLSTKIYYYISLIVFIIFMPSMFLAKMPYNNHDFSKTNYPRGLKILLLYIVVPLIAIYTTILYVYFIKIIVTRNWPIGLVSHLVLWYSILTVGVIFFIKPLINENKLARAFIFWFPKILIPIIMMMFLSIGIRIRTYGITENRYFILILGLWVLGIMVYFSSTKKFKSIIIPISLSIIVLNSVFGPLSSYSISKYSQNKRFEKILIKNNMLTGSNIVKAKSKISEKDKVELSMILNYFDRQHSLNDIRYLPDEFKIDNMEKVFGFSYTEPKYVNESIYFYFSSDCAKKPIEINEYDYLININNLDNKETKIKDSIKIDYNINNRMFKIIDDKKVIYEKDLNSFVKDIFNKHKNTQYTTNIDINEMVFGDENEKVKVKFIFDSIGLESKDKVNIDRVNDMSFHIVIKIK